MEGRGHSSPSVEGQRLMQMISMIHACHITEHRKENRKTKMEIKKPYSVVPVQ